MDSKILESRLKNLAYRIVAMCEYLPKNKIAGIIEGQLLRSCFSAAANYSAACKGMSRKSFISKLSISFEESDETQFWLEVINELNLIAPEKLTLLLKESTELASILVSACKTSQAKDKLTATKKS